MYSDEKFLIRRATRLASTLGPDINREYEKRASEYGNVSRSRFAPSVIVSLGISQEDGQRLRRPCREDVQMYSEVPSILASLGKNYRVEGQVLVDRAIRSFVETDQFNAAILDVGTEPARVQWSCEVLRTREREKSLILVGDWPRDILEIVRDCKVEPDAIFSYGDPWPSVERKLELLHPSPSSKAARRRGSKSLNADVQFERHLDIAIQVEDGGLNLGLA